MQETHHTPTSTTYSTSLSFTQGFLLGQLSICLLLFFFIKFFIFGEAPSRHNKTSPASNDHNQSARARVHSFNTSAATPRNPIALSTSFSSRSSAGFNHGGTNSADLSDPTKNETVISRRTGSAVSSATAGILRPHPYPLTTTSVLTKTYYRYPGHQPESLDWFNVLIAQAIAQLRVDAASDGAILTSLTELLNGARKPDFLDEIRVTEISLGEEFPIFSNCRVIPVDDGGGDGSVRPGSSRSFGGGVGGGGVGGATADMDGARLQACMDVDLADALTLGIETKLVLNYPRPNTAVMPVALAVSVVRFSGTLSISFIPSPSPSPNPNTSATNPSPNPTNPTDSQDATNNTILTFSFHPDYRLELSTHSLLGSRSRLQDVPKIAQLVEARLRDWFDERCVEPRVQMVGLPSFWPRARNTRAAGGGDSGGGGVGGGAATAEGRGGLDPGVDVHGGDTAVEDGQAAGVNGHASVAGGKQYMHPSPAQNSSKAPEQQILRERTRPFRPEGEEPDGLRMRRMPGSLPL